MNLLLDIGNTRLKWLAAAELHAPLPSAQALAHAGAPAEALAALIGSWKGAVPQRVWLANVTGAAHNVALVAVVQQAWGLPVQLAASPAACAGWKSAYAEPSRLGVDRFLLMLALWRSHRAAFCVASAGTALTFDAVDASGQHLGGVIAPGLNALVAATLGSTRFATGSLEAGSNEGLGRTTEACVQLGAVHAAAGLLERLHLQHSGPATLAGGDAGHLLPLLKGGWQVQHDLVLQGLATYALTLSGQ